MALLVHAGDVTRVKPTVAKQVLGLLRALPIWCPAEPSAYAQSLASGITYATVRVLCVLFVHRGAPLVILGYIASPTLLSLEEMASGCASPPIPRRLQGGRPSDGDARYSRAVRPSMTALTGLPGRANGRCNMQGPAPGPGASQSPSCLNRQEVSAQRRPGQNAFAKVAGQPVAINRLPARQLHRDGGICEGRPAQRSQRPTQAHETVLSHRTNRCCNAP
jgi:hypothetical protein